MVQGTQCSSGDECPIDSEPPNGVSLLQTQMNLNQRNVPYVLSERGASTCPSGFQTITDKETCQTAGATLLEEERAIDPRARARARAIPTAPHGCISHQKTMYFFNTA